jgi:uncharacterized RDD family membrane protein YckC
VAGRVTGVVVDTVEPDVILNHVDVNRLLDRVDLDRVMDRIDLQRVVDRIKVESLLARIDLDHLIGRVDLNQAIQHVDLNELLGRVDLNLVFDRVDVGRLLDRVDLNPLLDRVDLDRVLARVDLDRALSTVDVKALTARSGIPEIVAQSTSRMAGSALDVARRQVAGLDLLIDRGLRRRPATIMPGPRRLLSATSEEGRYSVTGYYAGPLSRAVGAVLDAIIVFATFTLGFAAVNLLSTVVLGISLDQERTGIVATVAFAVWWFSYSFVCLAVSGRTVGKGLIGIRVVAADGQSVAVRRAFVRTLTFPLSVLFLGLGFVPLVVRRDHRALHDLLATTCVVSDWGDRPAQLSGPLTAFLRRASPDTAPLG